VFKSIRALAIYVTDMGRAKKFYTEILGFQVSAELGPNLCFLESASGDIHIYLEGGNKPTSIDKKTSRLSFFLQAAKSAPETYAVLKKAGVKLLQDAPEFVGDGTLCFQFEDPDGNIINVAGKS
jgi:predicted enzyme related to lactoylglutathione lyase